MFKVQPLILTSFLFGTTAALDGCYSTWSSGGNYNIGSKTSATVAVTTGAGTDNEVTTNVKKNYECISGVAGYTGLSHCPNYDPASAQSSTAWKFLADCDGTAPAPATSAPTTAPTHPQWAGAGCPDDWVDGGDYQPGEKAAINGVAYKCSDVTAVNLWCGNSLYKPGDSLYWENAWTLLGSCDGTIAPTASPNWSIGAWDGAGCPEEYDGNQEYEAGDRIAVNGVVLQCKAWPNSAFCGRTGYEPLGPNSNSAWTILGTCTGTIAPTSSPDFDALEDQNGCPEAFSDSAEYEAADRVSVDIDGTNSLVYQCKAFPDSGYCNQYEPGHWSKLGWTLTGFCEGTIAPTGSPDFNPARDQDGCPEAFDEDAKYEASDKVSTPVTADTSLVWQCSSDVHQARYCNQQVPGNEYKLGWNLLGHCEGTIAPTASPDFVALTEVGNGCPDVYDKTTDYESGDLVSVALSDDASGNRGVVYQCKSWPEGAYCNAGVNFAPGTDNSAMGWSLKGSCDGTTAPTASPVVFAAECDWMNGTVAVPINTWSKADLASYKSGTRVRKGGDVYKCKGYPFYLWCRSAAYEPAGSGPWGDAWTAAGECAAV
mmetsp:Transcript_20788/g.44973  ORF Transcript_20788/g.44973 Transcript_20788/m.44973 type:complete len:597 (-) Transcript_20788:139-1929(-)